MSHLANGLAVENFGYALHHFAKAFGRFPWEVRDAVERGDVQAGDVLHAMGIESADARGQQKRMERERQKVKSRG